MRFICVDDRVPDVTVSTLRAACEERAVPFVHVNAALFDFRDEDRAEPGDLLYRPAVSLRAQRVEQHLHAHGVTTFHRDPVDMYFGYVDSAVLFQRAGLSIPRSIYCITTDRRRLAEYVQRLDGFPIVMKVGGYSGGLGVIIIESQRSMNSMIDYALAKGTMPVLMPFIDDATHWRAVVVGDRVVASYRNVTDPGDFRTSATDDVDDYHAAPPAEALEMAVTATKTLRVDTAGVDILEHPSGKLFVLEANFPCYFAQAQQVAGVDVAGAMVDHLISKSQRLG